MLFVGPIWAIESLTFYFWKYWWCFSCCHFTSYACTHTVLPKYHQKFHWRCPTTCGTSQLKYTFVSKVLLWKVKHSCRRFPFDCMNPFGYTVAYALECIQGWFICFVISSCVACLGLAAFLLGIAGTKDLEIVLGMIQNNIKTKRNRTDAVKYLYQFIVLHSTIKQLSVKNCLS